MTDQLALRSVRAETSFGSLRDKTALNGAGRWANAETPDARLTGKPRTTVQQTRSRAAAGGRRSRDK